MAPRRWLQTILRGLKKKVTPRYGPKKYAEKLLPPLAFVGAGAAGDAAIRHAMSDGEPTQTIGTFDVNGNAIKTFQMQSIFQKIRKTINSAIPYWCPTHPLNSS